MSDQTLFSLEDLERAVPIGDDWGDVASNVVDLGLSVTAPIWRLERLSILQDIDDPQLIDDPDDADGLGKVERLLGALRRGAVLPPMVGLRSPDGLVQLHDGRHRYNAYVQSGTQ